VLIKEQVVQALRSGSFTVVHILLTIAAARAFEQEQEKRFLFEGDRKERPPWPTKLQKASWRVKQMDGHKSD